MAEKKATETAPRRASKEEREVFKQKITEAKAAGTGFKEFYASTALEYPDLNEGTLYGWWNSAKGAEAANATAENKATTNPSEKLAVLLRKEGLLVERVKQAQADLAAVRKEVESLWSQRQKVTDAATK